MAAFEDEFPESLKDMVQNADRLMYSAKESGKDMIVAELVHLPKL